MFQSLRCDSKGGFPRGHSPPGRRFLNDRFWAPGGKLTATASLLAADVETFHRDGFFVLRSAISADECDRLKGAAQRRLETRRYTITVPAGRAFPEPAKYTIAASDWAEPDLAFIVEHPTVLDAVEAVLGKAPVLTAFVAYSRTPNDVGAAAHCDHKRWRPVGSSLNWCFAIVPLVDFDEESGPLLVSPGSHRLIRRVRNRGDRTLSVTGPERSALGPFIDPQLERGDLLLLHGDTWHEAPASKSERLRIGIFNKYAAGDAPPAAGYFKWSDSVYDALGPLGRQVLPLHSDRELLCARLVLERTLVGATQVLLRRSERGGWELPGGMIEDERNRALELGLDGAWDVGNKIAALEEVCSAQIGICPTWMSYIADYDEGSHLCRVYGAVLPAEANDPALPSGARWFAADDVAGLASPCAFLEEAVELWLTDGIVRGKGKAEHRCIPTDGPNQYQD